MTTKLTFLLALCLALGMLMIAPILIMLLIYLFYR